jgi:hypothetical protein
VIFLTFAFWIIGIFIFLFVVNLFIDSGESELVKSNNRKTIINEIRSDSNFVPTKSYFSKNNKSGIEINEENKMVRLFFMDGEEVKSKIYPFSSIIESEIKVDNQSVLKTSRSSQLAGAVVGGVFAGGVGAIIGGLSGEKTKNEYIKNVDLYIKVRDYSTPLFKINFLSNIDELGFENKKGFKKNHKDVQSALQDVEYWHSIMDLIIKDNS